MRQECRDLVLRHARPVPRYTSYPTAVQFSDDVTSGDYRAALAALPADAGLSAYVHIPYCHELCWYCGCNTKAVRRYTPVSEYLEVLLREIDHVGSRLPARHVTRHLHWGGGSPNILSAPDIARLAERLRATLNIDALAEFAVEIDPRTLAKDQADAFAEAGVDRLSIGVQDFNPEVQAAINRIQPFEKTQRVIELFRDRGVRSINVDLVYGLPHQTLARALATVDKVIQLAPDRIACFGYAHLPSRLIHQRLIPTESLAGPIDRFDMSERIADRLVSAGYRRIGLDHFARSGDAMADAPVRRNFQGYTTDGATDLIGLGASSIGKAGRLYVQNATAIAEYGRRVASDGLATARGLRMSDDDMARAFVIEQLMCDFAFSSSALEHQFGPTAMPILREAQAIVAGDTDGLMERTDDGFLITERGRPFVRSICASFDTYLMHGSGRHASGV